MILGSLYIFSINRLSIQLRFKPQSIHIAVFLSLNNSIMCANKIILHEKNSAFKKRVSTYVLKNQEHINLNEFFQDAYEIFAIETKKLIRKFRVIKLNTNFEAKYKRKFSENEDSDDDKTIFYIPTNNIIIDRTTNLPKIYARNISSVIENRIDDLQANGSGWTLDEIISLTVNNNKYESFSGSSYIPSPQYILSKKAVINIENTDNQCFKWSILAAIYPATKNAHRPSKYKEHINKLNFDNIVYPVTLEQIKVFEKQNVNISINVYVFERWYDEKIDNFVFTIVPVRLSKNVKCNHIHLLLLTEEVKSTTSENVLTNTAEVKTHYCYIKNLAKLVKMQCTKSKTKIHVCDRCLHYFYSEQKLIDHQLYCVQQNNCRITMPEKNYSEYLSFHNYRKKMDVPYIIYADIESLLLPTITNDLNNGDIDCNKPSGAYQKHVAYCIGFYFHCRHNPTQSFYKSYSGKNCIDWFVNEIYKIGMLAAEQIKVIIPMNLSEIEQTKFNEATECHICEQKFNGDELKCRDHSHLTGKYRGAAHATCNFSYREPKIITIVFHNLNYDLHFLIEKIASGFEGKMDIIPINSENYISFSKEIANTAFDFANQNYNNEKMKLRFIDSFRFLPESLLKLASYLPKDKLSITKNEWKQLSPENLNMLCTKGIYPYDYMDCESKMSDQQLPPKEAFYNKLNNHSISNEEYQFAQSVWKEFNIQNMLEYTDIYLKTDVLLLADVFENFRNTSLNLYGLDPAHYFTTAMLSWDAMLKYTGERIELLTDIDMLMFVERGIRGGVSQCSQRHCKANNKYMANYENSEESNYLMYFDVNNLYGWAMTQYLPHSNFEWTTINNIEAVIDTSDDSEFGYLIEADFEYPPEIHNLHNDYPMCPEHMIPPGSKQKKLLLNLFNKSNYVLHYRTLKMILSHGLILKKVHRILKFNQKPWLKPYIILNTNERSKATNEFEKNFFKLMSNAIYGKTMENVRNHVDIKLKTEWEGRYGAKNLIVKPNFKKRVIFNENLVAIEMFRTNVVMTKPIIVGMSVLEISKLCMYEFHYDFMLSTFNFDDCKLQYTDTDSFIYNIKCDDAYRLLRENSERFDTSDYPINNPYNIELKNKKIPGLMKDENNGKIMTEFVGLRSKMYSIRVNGIDNIKKAKGVKKNVIDKKLSFERYLDCIIHQCNIKENQFSIRSKLHQVYSVKQLKSALDPFDDKRHILPNHKDTMSWGHYSLRNQP